MQAALGCRVSAEFDSVAFSFLVDVKVSMDLETQVVSIPVKHGAETEPVCDT